MACHKILIMNQKKKKSYYEENNEFVPMTLLSEDFKELQENIPLI